MGRVFVTSVWGFEPHRWAGQGFSDQGTRDKLIREYKSDDALLLVATFGPEAEKDERGMLLGLARLGSKALPTEQVVEPEMYNANRFQNNGRIKWPYSVPFTSAWQFDRPLRSRRELLPRLQDDKLGMKIGTGYEELHASEAALIMSLPKTQVRSLYRSEQMVAQESLQNSVANQNNFRNGPSPTFRHSLLLIEDSPAFVYQLEFIGDLPLALGRKAHTIIGQNLFKIGWSVDPVNRQKMINSFMPNPQTFGWKFNRSYGYDSRLKAFAVEQSMLEALKGYRHHGEMILCSEKTIDSVWNANVYNEPATDGLVEGYQQSMLLRL